MYITKIKHTSYICNQYCIFCPAGSVALANDGNVAK